MKKTNFLTFIFTENITALIIIICAAAETLCGKCPAEEVIKPCICTTKESNKTYIICSGNENINLQQIFNNMSLNLDKNDTHFEGFVLNNTAITKIEDNTFHNIKFRTIELNDVQNLERIASNAFFPNNIFTIEEVHQWGDTLLGGHNNSEELFKALSSLLNVSQITFDSTVLDSIPTHAFDANNETQTNLILIDFNSINMPLRNISSVGNYAFYNLNGLEYLNLQFQEINYIPVHAFEFSKASENKLYIRLFGNQLNDTSIEVGAFANAKRPLQINLQLNNFTYLDEKVFAPILLANKENSILVDLNPLECDCRMHWLTKNKEIFQNQLRDHDCKNHKRFWNLTETDFQNCNG